MNVRHTREPLDSFDVALLSELRREVARRQSSATHRRRPNRRTLALAGVAGTTAVALGVGMSGSTAAAYELRSSGNGDIKITIHRLDDAAGLEDELAANGIKAHVDYRPVSGTGPQVVEDQADDSAKAPLIVKPGDPGAGADKNGTNTVEEGNAASSPCFEKGAPALDAHPQGDSYVISIRKDSVLHRSDSALEVTTRGDVKKGAAGLTVNYTVDGALCQLGTFTSR